MLTALATQFAAIRAKIQKVWLHSRSFCHPLPLCARSTFHTAPPFHSPLSLHHFSLPLSFTSSLPLTFPSLYPFFFLPPSPPLPLSTLRRQDSKAAQKLESKLTLTTQGYSLRGRKLQDAVLSAFDALSTQQRDYGTTPDTHSHTKIHSHSHP